MAGGLPGVVVEQRTSTSSPHTTLPVLSSTSSSTSTVAGVATSTSSQASALTITNSQTVRLNTTVLGELQSAQSDTVLRQDQDRQIFSVLKYHLIFSSSLESVLAR